LDRLPEPDRSCPDAPHTGLRGCSKLKFFTDVRQCAELASCVAQLDLNVRHFGRNCDHVLIKRGDHVAQTAASVDVANAFRRMTLVAEAGKAEAPLAFPCSAARAVGLGNNVAGALPQSIPPCIDAAFARRTSCLDGCK
jgi:hypothetical protein